MQSFADTDPSLFALFVKKLGLTTNQTDLNEYASNEYADLMDGDEEYHRLKTLIGLWEFTKANAAKKEAVTVDDDAKADVRTGDNPAGGRNTQKTRNNKRYKKNSRRYIRKNNKK